MICVLLKGNGISGGFEVMEDSAKAFYAACLINIQKVLSGIASLWLYNGFVVDYRATCPNLASLEMGQEYDWKDRSPFY